MISDAIKLLLEAANTLWRAKDELRNNRREDSEQIAEACGSIAEVLIERRDAFLSGRGLQRIDQPHYLFAMERFLKDRLPDHEDANYLELLSSAAGAVDDLEGMTGADFERLSLQEKDELILPLNRAIGEFRALSQALRF